MNGKFLKPKALCIARLELVLTHLDKIRNNLGLNHKTTLKKNLHCVSTLNNVPGMMSGESPDFSSNFLVIVQINIAYSRAVIVPLQLTEERTDASQVTNS